MVTPPLTDAKKQYIWLIRYGKTEFPLVENQGPYDSDIDPTEGIDHAKCIAESIISPISGSKGPTPLPDQIYASPFIRTTHTASILCQTLNQKNTTTMNNSTKVRIEEGLYEYLAPSLLIKDGVMTYAKSLPELVTKYSKEDTIDPCYKSVNPLLIDPETKKLLRINDDDNESKTHDNGDGDFVSPYFPEDDIRVLLRCQTTLNELLNQHASHGENIAIVTHAPCVQAIAFAMEEDAKRPQDSKSGQWPLGGVTRFSRDVMDSDDSTCAIPRFGEWNCDFYGNTEHMPGEYKSGLGWWSLPSLDN